MSSCSGQCSSCTSNCEKREEAPSRLLKIPHKILVLSGKGGVGKSTVSAALALSLAAAGKKVALLDVDFHGPSQPTLFHVQDERMSADDNGLIPLETAGIKLVSLGLLLEDENAAVIWRGPAKIGVLKQLFEEVNWGTDLDYLILDFPPGTGDEVLSACQMIQGDKEAVMVTTPQEVSLADCRKCLDFCNQLAVPVLGIVENMSGFVCPTCHTRHAIFSAGGGKRLAEDFEVPLLAQVPLDPVFLQACDRGNIPQGLKDAPAVKKEFDHLAQAILEQHSTSK